MDQIVNSKTLRARMAEIFRRVLRGERFTVIYRSRPVCRLIPPGAPGEVEGDPEADPLYKAGPVGRSKDGLPAASHDQVLYEARSR